METHKTYISYVIQSGEQHIHHSQIVNLPMPRAAVYTDNTSQKVLKWSIEKQRTLEPSDKLIVLNYFNISNVN